MGRYGRVEHRGRGGFTIIEVMIALVVVLIALAGYSRSVVSTMVASETAEEVRNATEAARATMERIQGTDFATVWARYNADPGDDPGTGVSPGAGFAVEGFQPRAGDADGFVGEVLFPSVLVGGDLQLREDAQMPRLGMPRDLNADGAVDAADHSGNYFVLPVRVRLEWAGSRGPGAVEFQTLLSGI